MSSIIDHDSAVILRDKTPKYRKKYAARYAARLKQYSLTEADYQLMLEVQNFACKACKSPFLQEVPCIDHDHLCCLGTGFSCGQCIRGLLCHRCNRALGQVRDSVVTLNQLIQYLEDSRMEHETS